jgi:hypothetical protein
VKRIATLALVLMGVVALLEGAQWLAYPFQTVAFGGEGFVQSAIAFALALLPSLVAFAVAVVLFRNAPRIAESYGSDEGAVPPVEPTDLVRAGVVLFGLWCLIQGVPSLFGAVISPFVSKMMQTAAEASAGFSLSSPTDMFLQFLRSGAAPFAYVIAGIFMLRRRDWVVERVLSIRSKPKVVADEPKATCPNCGVGYDPADYDGVFGTPACEVCKQPLESAQNPVAGDPRD